MNQTLDFSRNLKIFRFRVLFYVRDLFYNLNLVKKDV